MIAPGSRGTFASSRKPRARPPSRGSRVIRCTPGPVPRPEVRAARCARARPARSAPPRPYATAWPSAPARSHARPVLAPARLPRSTRRAGGREAARRCPAPPRIRRFRSRSGGPSPDAARQRSRPAPSPGPRSPARRACPRPRRGGACTAPGWRGPGWRGRGSRRTPPAPGAPRPRTARSDASTARPRRPGSCTAWRPGPPCGGGFRSPRWGWRRPGPAARRPAGSSSCPCRGSVPRRAWPARAAASR